MSDHVCKQTLPQADHAWYHGGVVRVVSGHQAIHGYTLIRTQKIESYNIEFDYFTTGKFLRFFPIMCACVPTLPPQLICPGTR